MTGEQDTRLIPTTIQLRTYLGGEGVALVDRGEAVQSLLTRGDEVVVEHARLQTLDGKPHEGDHQVADHRAGQDIRQVPDTYVTTGEVAQRSKQVRLGASAKGAGEGNETKVTEIPKDNHKTCKQEKRTSNR